MTAPRLTRLERRALEQLKILCAAWFIATDDNRRPKLLHIAPSEYRRWKRLRDDLARKEGSR
jgi:hypothetical protein